MTGKHIPSPHIFSSTQLISLLTKLIFVRLVSYNAPRQRLESWRQWFLVPLWQAEVPACTSFHQFYRWCIILYIELWICLVSCTSSSYMPLYLLVERSLWTWFSCHVFLSMPIESVWYYPSIFLLMSSCRPRISLRIVRSFLAQHPLFLMDSSILASLVFFRIRTQKVTSSLKHVC